MYRKWIATLGLVAVAAGSALAQSFESTEITGTVPARDQFPGQILSKLHALNRVEIALGRLAAQRAMSSAVKDFATQVLAEHHTADESLFVHADRLSLTIINMNSDIEDMRLLRK